MVAPTFPRMSTVRYDTARMSRTDAPARIACAQMDTKMLASRPASIPPNAALLTRTIMNIFPVSEPGFPAAVATPPGLTFGKRCIHHRDRAASPRIVEPREQTPPRGRRPKHVKEIPLTRLRRIVRSAERASCSLVLSNEAWRQRRRDDAWYRLLRMCPPGNRSGVRTPSPCASPAETQDVTGERLLSSIERRTMGLVLHYRDAPYCTSNSDIHLGDAACVAEVSRLHVPAIRCRRKDENVLI